MHWTIEHLYRNNSIESQQVKICCFLFFFLQNRQPRDLQTTLYKSWLRSFKYLFFFDSLETVYFTKTDGLGKVGVNSTESLKCRKNRVYVLNLYQVLNLSHAIILVPFRVSCVMCVLLLQGILNRPQPCNNTVLDSEYVDMGYLLKQWFSLGIWKLPLVLEKSPMRVRTKIKKTWTSYR